MGIGSPTGGRPARRDHPITPFLVREYTHAVDEASERHHAAGAVAPPTIVHAHKTRILDHACPAGAGPTARIHLVYDATHHRTVPATSVVQVSGVVSGRYERRGREHLVIDFEVRDKRTGVLYTTYRDTSLLGFEMRA